MRNNLLLLHFFSIFLNPQRVTLTYSAMTDGPIDVQLRWANLRAREHHVKGPKKSPRKMVLRRLILRKAEEAKRTTTWAPYRVQCPCLQCQNQPRWILPNFPSVDMGTLSKTVGFSLYPCHWVLINNRLRPSQQKIKAIVKPLGLKVHVRLHCLSFAT